MSHLIITSRFAFKLTHHERNLVEERLQKICLTSFQGSEVNRKIKELINIDQHPKRERLINAGYSNPFLLEQINRIAGETPSNDNVLLEAAIEKIQEDFIKEQGLYELFQQCSESLKRILKRFNIYDKPITEYSITRIEEVTGIKGVKNFLWESMDLDLVEYEPANNTYNLTPLLKEKLKK